MLTPRNFSATDAFIKDECQKNILAYSGCVDTVVDIGAHVGFFTYAAINKGAKQVWSFEPTPTNFQRLVLNLTDDGLLGRVIPIPLAVAGARDVLSIGRVGHNNGQHGLLMKATYAGPSIARTVPLRMIANLLPQRIDYLKIDIEGAEYLAFDDDGAVADLLGRTAFLEMELHGVSNCPEFDADKLPEQFKDDCLGTIHAIVQSHGFTENIDIVKNERRILSRNLRGAK